MRIGLLRTPIEIWDTKKTLNEYGVEVDAKELMLSCRAAIKQISADIVGDTTKSIIDIVEITIRFNRYFKTPNSSMFVVFDGLEYDIVTPPNNNWRLNKYITFKAVRRNK